MNARSQLAAELGGGRKVAALITVCVSLMVVTLDVTILNVALPTLGGALEADNAELQWFVNAYELVFAGLLLTAGAVADRFGRRRALAVGLAVFALASALSASARSPGALIAFRVAMGVGGALIVPSTLAIVTTVYTERAERGRAIGVWAGVAGVGLGLGPLVGGVLLQRFYWGSVFLINVPLALGALAAGRVTIPESRHATATRLDPLGATLSIAGIGGLLYAITEGPERGWSSAAVGTSLAVAAGALVAFVLWERRTADPMLDLAVFRDRHFSAAIIAIAALFFGVFGLMFVSTQALQAVLDHDTLGAGIRLVPLPALFVVCAQLAVRLSARVGTRAVVTCGLIVAATGLAVGAGFDATTGYWPLAVALILTGAGMGFTMAPAVELIMSAAPTQRAGRASAINDTIRLTAAAIGVAVVGSLLTTSLRAALRDAADTGTVPTAVVAEADRSIGEAAAVAHRLGGPAGDRVRAVAIAGFADGARRGLIVAATVAAAGAVVAWFVLPSRHRISRGATPQPGVSTASAAAFSARPIGWVESTLTNRRCAPQQGDEGAPDVWIAFVPEAVAGLSGLETGSDVFVLTWLDRARRDVLVVHRRGEPANPPAGVFSTRSPDRPNPIGLHRVRVRAVEHARLRVGPLDALDRTPVLDIKPVLDSEQRPSAQEAITEPTNNWQPH